MTAEARTLDLSGGTTLRYFTSGSGPTVLMIQGVGVTATGWRPQVDALSSRFRVITFDNRGIGGSTSGPEPRTVDRRSTWRQPRCVATGDQETRKYHRRS